MSFIVVKYGDNREELFNFNCRNDSLLQFIKQKCNCQSEDVIELCDESGKVKQLQSHLLDYGSSYCAHREKLVLARVEVGDENRPSTYIPLLDGLEENQEFLANLNPKPLTTGRKGKQPTATDKAASREKKVLKTKQPSRAVLKAK